MTGFKYILDEKPPYQVLSFDAGGIYGLSTAIMLRKLCEKNDQFLNGNDVTLFAGTSIGGLISLYLAMFEQPRVAVLQNDNMEAVFAEPLLYSNMLNPVQGFLSLFGLTAWSGEADFKALLKIIFQNKTLGDLKQRVMITCFNYCGNNEGEAGDSGWRTNIYSNFLLGNTQNDIKIADVAYNACSFPGLRPLPEGLSDGGIFAPDPSVAGIAAIISRRKGELENVGFVRYVVDNVLNKTMEEIFKPIINRLGMNTTPQEPSDVIDNSIKETINHILEACDDGLGKLKELKSAPSGDIENNFLDIKSVLEKLKVETSRNEIFHTLLELIQLIIGSKGVLNIFAKLDISMDSDCKKRLEGQREHFKNYFDYMSVVIKDVKSAMKNPGAPIEGKEDDEHIEQHVFKMFPSLITNVHQLLIESTPSLKGSLEDITLLSLGTGQKNPYYWLKPINFGTSLFSLLPTNPLTGNWYPPQIMTALQAPSSGANQGAEALLCLGRYRRLNPPVMQPPLPPVLPATYYARNPFLRKWIIDGIYTGMKTNVAKAAIEETADWLKQHWKSKQGTCICLDE